MTTATPKGERLWLTLAKIAKVLDVDVEELAKQRR